jgi:hypothetical protein
VDQQLNTGIKARIRTELINWPMSSKDSDEMSGLLKFRPAIASQFVTAADSHPFAYEVFRDVMVCARVLTMKSSTRTSPFLLDIFDPSGFRSSGRCPNFGSVSLRRAYKERCSGRDGSHSCHGVSEIVLFSK